MPLVDRDQVAVLDNTTDLVDIGEIDLGIDALREKIHPQRNQADVAGALPVAKQAALDTVRTRHHCQFRGGDGGAPIIVRMY
jgi:hypothetical protein